MRVAVDIRPFYEPLTGVGWYLLHLLQELSKRQDIELIGMGDARVTEAGPRLHVELPRGMDHLFFDLRDLPESSFGRRLTAAAYLPLIWLDGSDLTFGANFFLPRLMSAVARRRVITIHDLTFKRFPELMQQETLSNLRQTMTRETVNADAIICVSESTRRDVLDSFDVNEDKVVTIHSGINPPHPATRGQGVPEGRYILFVGTIEPRKDVDTLLDAFERLKKEARYEGRLVLVGKVGWKSEKSIERIERSRWRSSILHLSYLNAPELSAIYQSAEMLVFPSRHEGFGFPLLEAMSYGLPVIAASNSSLPEVGGEAALYFETGNSTELASLIERLSGDAELRTALVARGRARVGDFPWSRAAEKTFQLFQRVASS